MSDRLWKRGLQTSAVLMNFLAIFCVETAVFAAFPSLDSATEGWDLRQPSLLCQLCLILLPFIFWIIREKARYFWLFIGTHGVVAVTAVLVLGQSAMQRLVFGIFTAGYLVSSLRIRLTGHETEDGHENVNGKGMEEKRLGPVISGILAIGTYLLCVYMENEVGCTRIWNTALLFAFLFFIDIYFQNVNRFVEFNRSSNSHIPVRGMMIRGGTLTLGFGTAVTLILAAASDNKVTRTVTEILKNAVLWLVRTIGRAVAYILSLFEGEGGEIVEESAPAQMMGPMGVAEATEQSLWMEIFSKIVEMAILIGAAAIVSVFLYKVISEAIRRFYLKKDTVQEKNGQMIEIREKLKKEREKKNQEKGLSYFSRTPEERIRKSFVKTVRKTEKFRNPDGRAGGAKGKDLWRREAQENLLKGLTAKQICDVVELTGQSGEPRTGWLGISLDDAISDAEKEEAKKLLSLYEKARYGMGSTAEDARAAEQTAGKLATRLGRR